MRLPASAITSCEITTLNHKVFNYTMEFAAFVSFAKEKNLFINTNNIKEKIHLKQECQKITLLPFL